MAAARGREFVIAKGKPGFEGCHPDITATLSGLESLDNVFKSLDADVRRKMLSAAMRKAQKPFKDEIKRNTAKGPTGNLKRAATTSVKVNRRSGFIHSWTGYRKKGKRGAPHAHLVEWGTGGRTWSGFAVGNRPVQAGTNILRARRRSWSVGAMPAALVQTRSWKKHKHKPLDVFRSFMRVAIVRAARKQKGFT